MLIESIPYGLAQSDTSVQYFECNSQTASILGVDTFGVSTYGRLVSNGVGLSNVKVQFSYKVSGAATWQSLAKENTSSNGFAFSSTGNFAFNWLPIISTYYVINLTWAGNNVYSGGTVIANYATTAFNNNQKQYIFSAFSNSTLTDLTFDPTTNEEKFGVNGPSGTTGDSQICIPKSLFPAIEKTIVMLDGAAIDTSDYQSVSNDYWSVHFTYNNSDHFVVIALAPASTQIPTPSPIPTPTVPEFSLWTIPLLFMIMITGGLSVYFKKYAQKKCELR
jgi:hypothetical protein